MRTRTDEEEDEGEDDDKVEEDKVEEDKVEEDKVEEDKGECIKVVKRMKKYPQHYIFEK